MQINKHPFDCVLIPNHPHSLQVSSVLSLIYMPFLPDLCQMHLQIFMCSHIIIKFYSVGCFQTLWSKAQFGFSIIMCFEVPSMSIGVFCLHSLRWLERIPWFAYSTVYYISSLWGALGNMVMLKSTMRCLCASASHSLRMISRSMISGSEYLYFLEKVSLIQLIDWLIYFLNDPIIQSINLELRNT